MPQAEVTLPIKPSRRLAHYLTLMAVVPVVPALSYLPVEWSLALALVVAGCLVHVLRLHAWRTHPRAIVALWCGHGSLACDTRAGAWRDVSAAPGGFVAAWLTVIKLQSPDGSVRASYLVLVPGCMAADHYRRLRVHLRWARASVARGHL